MLVCASCGHANSEGAKFCEECGFSFAAVPEGAKEQRKTVTVLFCDLTGSTALGETLDPERLRALLARYFERMRAIVERHGGSVEKFIGDAVMAVFGVPVLHEDDALRALRSAAEMRDALPELGLQGRIGVMTGEVVTGTEERLATGDAVNVAARLEQAAEQGEVLIGAPTLALAGHAAEVEPVEPLVLKGKAEPVPAYRLLHVREAPERRHEAPFVGRERELALVGGVWERVRAEQCCELVTVIGDAGVGKSRLAAELLASLEATVVRGRCLPYGEGITYWPVVGVLKQLDLLPPDEAAALAIRLLLGETEAATSAEEIAWAFRKTLEHASAERPLVVVFEDIQWGEQTLLDLIEHVALLSSGAAILLLCIARPELTEHRPAWPVTLRLEPLRHEDVEELIPERIAGELREKITRAAGGNPLFIEEMLAMAGEAAGEVAVPPTLQALLGARLDQLETAERNVLQRGAIEGETFHRGAVQALAPEETQVTPRLAALVRKELIRPDRSQLAGEDGFRFRHLLIRDAAYDALPKATRAELHERFADWLEERGADLVERDEIVGYHLERAYGYRTELGPADAAAGVLAERAAGLLAGSGRRARFRGDRPAAAGLLARAAALSPSTRRAIITEITSIWLEIGELERAATFLDEMLAEARAAGDERVEAIAALAKASVAAGRGEPVSMEYVITLAERAEAVLDRHSDDAQLAAVLEIEGRHRFFAGHGREGVAVLERALELALGAGDLPTAQECLGWIWVAKVFSAASVSECRDTFARVPKELSDTLSSRLFLLIHAGLIDGLAGGFARARGQLAEAKALAEELGVRTTSASISMYTGHVELLADDPAAAERELRDGYDRLGELGESGFRSTVATILAEALVELGRESEAADVLDTAETLAQPDDIDPQVRLHAVRARILAQRGELAEAERTAREGIATAAATDYIVQHGDALLALAAVLQTKGEDAEAATTLREALDLYERKGNLVKAERVRARLAELQDAAPR